MGNKTYLAVLVATIVAGTALFFSLPIFGTTAKRGAMTKSLSNAKQLGLAANLYAMDHDGRFPMHLSEVMPDYVPAGGLDELLYNAKIRDEKQPRLQHDWLYFGALFDQKRLPTLLIASPLAIRDGQKQKRVVIFGDISGQILNDGDYQPALRKTIEEMNVQSGMFRGRRPEGSAPGPE